MNVDQLRLLTPELDMIARKHGIKKIYVFGSIARGSSTPESDVDFLVEMQDGASLFGVAGFAWETERLLGVHVDVVPSSVLSRVKDRDFVMNLQKEALPL